MSAATEFAPAIALPAPSALPAQSARSAQPARRLAVVPASEPLRGVPPRRSALSPVTQAPTPAAAPVTVLHRPRSAAEAAPVRLTRRGVVVLAGALAALGAGLVWLASASAGAGAAPATPHIHAVTVGPGDTLWSIADRVAPGRDPRAEVAALQRRNHLASVDLVPGQRLLVP